jgi:hypothetical protein
MAPVSKEDVHSSHAEPIGAKEKAHAAHAGHENEQEDYLWGV